MGDTAGKGCGTFFMVRTGMLPQAERLSGVWESPAGNLEDESDSRGAR